MHTRVGTKAGWAEVMDFWSIVNNAKFSIFLQNNVQMRLLLTIDPYMPLFFFNKSLYVQEEAGPMVSGEGSAILRHHRTY